MTTRAQTLSLGLLLTLLLAGCTSVPLHQQQPVTYSLPPADEGRIAQRLSDEGFALDDASLSALRLITTGHQAWEDRLRLVQLADSSLDLQYFSWSEDESGRVMLSHVVDAADRGVRVRLLLDDMLVLNQAFFSPVQAHPNVEIRLFNPFATQRMDTVVRPFEWLAKDRLNVRMHNKILIADGLVGVIGGRNIQNRYFWVDPKFVHRDLDVLALGAVVDQFNTSFDDYWNSPWSVPLQELERIPSEENAAKHYAKLRDFRESEHVLQWFSAVDMPPLDDYRITTGVVTGEAELLADPPDKVEAPRDEKFQTLVDRLEADSSERVLIGMAYVIPDKAMISHWQNLLDRGVEVELLTNSMAAIDFSAAYSGWKPYRENLVSMGVTVYEFAVDAHWASCGFNCSEGHKSYHSKLLVSDNDLSYVGSLNYDPRSIDLNTEAGILVRSKGFAHAVANNFYADANSRNAWLLTHSSPLSWRRPALDGNGEEVMNSDPSATFSRRWGVRFWGALPLGDQY